MFKLFSTIKFPLLSTALSGLILSTNAYAVDEILKCVLPLSKEVSLNEKQKKAIEESRESLESSLLSVKKDYLEKIESLIFLCPKVIGNKNRMDNSKNNIKKFVNEEYYTFLREFEKFYTELSAADREKLLKDWQESEVVDKSLEEKEGYR